MLNVTQEQREAYNGNSIHKSLRIYFPNLNLTLSNNKIYEESMKLKEALIQGDTIEFVGCNASQFSIKVQDVTQELKNQRIEVYIKTDDTNEIPLFKGIVDSAKMETNRKFKNITAYDALYTKGQIDVASWYNSLTFPITIYSFRQSLFNYIGLTQKATTLPNDGISISKQYEPKTLKCLSVLKMLCQINGCFGIINRDGLFEYRYIYNKFDEVYPATTLFPPFFTVADHSGEGSEVANNFPFYKSISYEEYAVNPVQRLQIRKSEDDVGVTVGNASGNKYIIQNNMFARNLDDATLRTMGKRIWEKIANITFHPCSTDNNGLPFVEVGDVVDYALTPPNNNLLMRGNNNSSFDINSFNVMSRELTGIQALRDNYEASGEQEQSEFITDVQAQIDTIKDNGVNMQDYYTRDEMDTILTEDYYTQAETEEIATEITDVQIAQMETPTGFNIVSSYVLPTSRQANTLYLVGASVIVL